MLLKVSKFLVLPQVGTYLAQNKELISCTLSRIQDSANLDDDQFIGIVFASIHVGSINWKKLPEMIKNNKDKIPLLKNLQYNLE